MKKTNSMHFWAWEKYEGKMGRLGKAMTIWTVGKWGGILVSEQMRIEMNAEKRLE